MRSCEYVEVSQQGKRHTNILKLQNLCFFKNRKLIKHNNPNLEFADWISVTFERQKKDKKNNTVTHMASDNDTLYPVR
jgi:hypothetical protein